MRRLNARKPAKPPPKMDPIKLHLRPTTRSSNLFSRSPSKQQPRPNLCILSSALISLSLLLCYLFLFPKNSPPSGGKRCSIVIDGGSTGTRIHVFSYSSNAGKSLNLDFGDGGVASMRVNPGLSAYAENPAMAGGSLRELVDFGRERVPRERWADTEIRLMATAGMRLLKLRVQDQILDSCRRALRDSGFKFRNEWASVITDIAHRISAKVPPRFHKLREKCQSLFQLDVVGFNGGFISGSDEGVYAWVVANYALGTLGGDPLQTTGIIELGGASAQVTFSSSEPLPPEFARTLKFGNISYNLYSHSFLHFGQNVAFESLRDLLISGDYGTATDALQKGTLINPCIPKGYSMDNKNKHASSIQSRGNFTECRSAALKLLQKGKDQCNHQQCYIGSSFTPKLQGKFLATENFFYTSKFYGLEKRAILSDLISAGQRFCGEDWSVLKKRHSSFHEEDLLHYCFSSAYIVAMLHDSLGIALNDERIRFTNEVGSVPLDWALGAFILESTESTDSEVPDWFTTTLGGDSHTVLSIVGILVILTLIGWSISKWRNPQMKTIYDLEKGRYIVTRVNRY